MKTGKMIRYAAGILICVLAIALFVNWKSMSSPLIIAANGNVGIGTDEPKTKLQVAGDVGVSGTLDLGVDKPGRERNAGKITYGTFDNDALCILGAGPTSDKRRITIWSEGGAQLHGSLNVNGRIKDQTGYVTPVGGIIMYTGNSVDLFEPDGRGKPNSAVQGWALCNGKNNTPNLIDRFIVGCGYGATTGKTGGEAIHRITVDEMPRHSHTYIDRVGEFIKGNYRGHAGDRWAEYVKTSSTSETGNGNAMPMLPPYYALFYIMKL